MVIERWLWPRPRLGHLLCPEAQLLQPTGQMPAAPSPVLPHPEARELSRDHRPATHRGGEVKSGDPDTASLTHTRGYNQRE